MKTSIIFFQIIIVCLLLCSCAVDPRWGPPRSGLEKNMSWQYTSMQVDSPPPAVSPISMTRSEPVIRPAQMARPALYNPAPKTPVWSSGQRKVHLIGSTAIAPSNAPEVIKRAVAAGNRLQRSPYKFGGGHARLNDTGYDCSGSVSYVLREAGIISDQMTSTGFLNYGESGKGDWITIWGENGHVYMTIGGLRLDTSGSQKRDGPRWRTQPRGSSGFRPRHPRGL
jgi:hypothetical protein